MCVVYTGGSPEVSSLLYWRIREMYLSFHLVLGSCLQRPRFRPNKGSAYNLAIDFDSAREY